jgi:hypothetical protein
MSNEPWDNIPDHAEDIDYFDDEIEQTRKLIDVEALLAFQLEHSIALIRGEDYQYVCYVDGKQCGSITLTPMLAMVTAIRDYTKAND